MGVLRNIVAAIAAVLIVLFAVVNRNLVPVNFWPFTFLGENGVFEIPLFAVLLIGVFLGVVLGGIAVWASGHHKRVEYRQLKRRYKAEELSRRIQEQREEEQAVERSRQRQQAVALAAPARR